MQKLCWRTSWLTRWQAQNPIVQQPQQQQQNQQQQQKRLLARFPYVCQRQSRSWPCVNISSSSGPQVYKINNSLRIKKYKVGVWRNEDNFVKKIKKTLRKKKQQGFWKLIHDLWVSTITGFRIPNFGSRDKKKSDPEAKGKQKIVLNALESWPIWGSLRTTLGQKDNLPTATYEPNFSSVSWRPLSLLKIWLKARDRKK